MKRTGSCASAPTSRDRTSSVRWRGYSSNITSDDAAAASAVDGTGRIVHFHIAVLAIRDAIIDNPLSTGGTTSIHSQPLIHTLSTQDNKTQSQHDYHATCLWNTCSHRRALAASPTAISFRQMGQVLSSPGRRWAAVITISGRDSIIVSVAP